MVCAVLCADLWKLWEIPSAIGWGFAPEVGVARKAGLSYRGCKDLKSEFVLSLNSAELVYNGFSIFGKVVPLDADKRRQCICLRLGFDPRGPNAWSRTCRGAHICLEKIRTPQTQQGKRDVFEVQFGRHVFLT